MSWRVRTGLPTAHLLAAALKKILQKYSEYYPGILSPEQLTKVNNLIDCCTEFLLDVPSHEPEA